MPSLKKRTLIKTPSPNAERVRKSLNIPKYRAWDTLLLVAKNSEKLEQERKRLRFSKSKAYDLLRKKIQY